MTGLADLQRDALLARMSDSGVEESARALAIELMRIPGSPPRHELAKLVGHVRTARAAARERLEQRAKLRNCGLRHLAVLATNRDTTAEPHD